MKKLVLISLLLISTPSITQELPKLTPVSPNAASLAQFGSFSVNKNLGRAQINVPIYNAKSGDLQIPISIDYNSSGIRLNDRASWVGLGWSLQAGGAIVCNVKGIPDRYGNARENIAGLSFNENNYNYLYDVFKGFDDGQPDRYILNAFGINACFYFIEKNGKEVIVFENNNSIKISKIEAPNYGFNVVTENGTSLIFNEREISKLPPTTYVGSSRDVTTAYYLTEIISPSKKDTISFQYKAQKSFDIPVETSEAIKFGMGENSGIPMSFINAWNNKIEIDKRYLDKITLKNGYIQFESYLDRNDLHNEYRLDNIKVYSKIPNSIDKLISEIHFNYSYYIRGAAPAQNNFEEWSKVRSLKLQSLTFGALNTSDSQIYTFDYDSQLLPSRGSKKQDFWGYINNNTTSSLIPETTFILHDEGYTPKYRTHTAGNANRDADPEKMKSGILTKITYPTGGYTVFEFEANQIEEVISVPLYLNKSKTVMSVGSGDCSGCVSNGKQSLNFTIDMNPLGSPIDENVRIMFSDAYSGQGSSSYGSFNGTKYYRNAPTNVYPYTIHDIPTSLTNGQSYTIEAEELGHGSNPPSYVPFSSVTVTWKEVSGNNSITQAKYIGGLRIHSIKNYDGINPLPVENTVYSYANPNVINKQKNGGFVMKYMPSSLSIEAILSSSSNYENGIDLLPTVEYGQITEYKYSSLNNIDNGKKIYTYENIPIERDIVDTRELYKHPLFDMTPFDGSPLLSRINEAMSNEDIALYLIKSYNHGFLKKEEIFKKEFLNGIYSYKIIKKEEYIYNTIDESFFKLNFVYSLYGPFPINWQTNVDPYGENDFNSLQFYFRTKKVFTGKKILVSSIASQYDSNGLNPVITSKNYDYNNKYLLSKTETKDSKGNTFFTKTLYPDDIKTTSTLQDDSTINGGALTITDFNAVERMKEDDLHQTALPVQIETTVKDVNSKLLSSSIQRTNYSEPYSNVVLPKDVQTLKGVFNSSTNTLQDRIEYQSYYANGNVREVSKADGAHIVYIWGYQEEYPIAKIENATFSQVSSQVSNLQNLSNSDNDRTIDLRDSNGNISSYEGNEGSLRQVLNSLRTSLPNAMVTTYTYDPLIGVTSITDPKGYTVYYEYDGLHRLKQVRDASGNILSENEYNYKQ